MVRVCAGSFSFGKGGVQVSSWAWETRVQANSTVSVSSNRFIARVSGFKDRVINMYREHIKGKFLPLFLHLYGEGSHQAIPAADHRTIEAGKRRRDPVVPPGAAS